MKLEATLKAHGQCGLQLNILTLAAYRFTLREPFDVAQDMPPTFARSFDSAQDDIASVGKVGGPTFQMNLDFEITG